MACSSGSPRIQDHEWSISELSGVIRSLSDRQATERLLVEFMVKYRGSHGIVALVVHLTDATDDKYETTKTLPLGIDALPGSDDGISLPSILVGPLEPG